jgi:hypothetical protein
MSEAIELILRTREKTYGNFLRQASIAADLKGVMRAYCEWTEVLAPDQREALEMIAVKIARVLNGDPNFADSWRDIEGYARLVANRLEEKE